MDKQILGTNIFVGQKVLGTTNFLGQTFLGLQNFGCLAPGTECVRYGEAMAYLILKFKIRLYNIQIAQLNSVS